MSLDLDELARLEREATPGPWKVVDHGNWWSVDGLGRTMFDDGSAADEYNQECTTGTRDLLVALRNAAPELLRLAREAERLRAAAAKAANIVSDVAASFGDEYQARMDQLAEAHALLDAALRGGA